MNELITDICQIIGGFIFGLIISMIWVKNSPKNTKRGKTNGTEMEFRRT